MQPGLKPNLKLSQRTIQYILQNEKKNGMKSLLYWDNGCQLAKVKKQGVIDKRLTLLKRNLLGSISSCSTHKSYSIKGAKATNTKVKLRLDKQLADI